jgi:mRNA interferase MazF
MRRGDLVTVAVQVDFRKPRPALVIQSNPFSALGSTTVLPITSSLVAAPLLRVTVQPSDQNGLLHTSQVMVDKAVTVMHEKVGPAFGHIDADAMVEVDRRLAVFLGIAK